MDTIKCLIETLAVGVQASEGIPCVYYSKTPASIQCGER